MLEIAALYVCLAMEAAHAMLNHLAGGTDAHR